MSPRSASAGVTPGRQRPALQPGRRHDAAAREASRRFTRARPGFVVQGLAPAQFLTRMIAIVPLLMFTTRRKYLGEMAFGRGMRMALRSAAGVVVPLNVWMLQRLLMA